MRRQRFAAVGPALGLLVLGGAAPVTAQQPITPPPSTEALTGTVVDAETGSAIAGAVVTLGDGDRRVLSDTDGGFSLSGVPPGAALLRVEGFGYESLLLPVNVAPGMERLEVRLQPSPLALEGIDVRGEARRGAVGGVVLDAFSGEGIPFAALWLRDERRFSTNERGAFRLDRVPPGSYLLLAQRMGYQGLYVHVDVSARTDPVVIRLEPDPIVLEGITVINDRLKSRRNAYPRIVRTFDEERLRRTGAPDAYSFLKFEALNFFQAPTLRRRGRWGVTRDDPTCPAGVYIDDQYILGGLDVLASYHPSQLYLVEVFGPGGQIRVYTHAYIEGQARRPRMIEPADLPPPSLTGC